MVMQGMMDFSTQMSNNITHLADGIRVDAAHWEDAMGHESLALKQEKLLKQEALEREKIQKQEAI